MRHPQVGGERYNLFTGCTKARTATIVLRGGSEQFIDEAERSLHDAIMIVRRALKHAHVVAGGGAIDMEVSWRVSDRSCPAVYVHCMCSRYTDWWQQQHGRRSQITEQELLCHSGLHSPG
jgi:shikimate kinase